MMRGFSLEPHFSLRQGEGLNGAFAPEAAVMNFVQYTKVRHREGTLPSLSN